MLVGMLRHALLLTFFVSGIVSLSACHLYVEEDTDDDVVRDGEMWPDDCDAIGCEPDQSPDGDEPPPPLCETNDECAFGCFCNSEGVCEESSLCFRHSDCAEGFVCNLGGTCVPSTEPNPATCDDHNAEPACVADAGCSPVYRGVNCTSESGEACTSQTADCSCESFAFDSCEDA